LSETFYPGTDPDSDLMEDQVIIIPTSQATSASSERNHLVKGFLRLRMAERRILRPTALLGNPGTIVAEARRRLSPSPLVQLDGYRCLRKVVGVARWLD
jgi:hypothetical protein